MHVCSCYRTVPQATHALLMGSFSAAACAASAMDIPASVTQLLDNAEYVHVKTIKLKVPMFTLCVCYNSCCCRCLTLTCVCVCFARLS